MSIEYNISGKYHCKWISINTLWPDDAYTSMNLIVTYSITGMSHMRGQEITYDDITWTIFRQLLWNVSEIGMKW